jgi:hypothetical protein
MRIPQSSIEEVRASGDRSRLRSGDIGERASRGKAKGAKSAKIAGNSSKNRRLAD